jgi:hypothetical protein
MTAPTVALHVDRVLADPLGVPRGLDHALRRMELGAREWREERSPLLRALRRPLLQIAPDTPGGRSLERCWEGVRGRANAAVELQGALDGIRAAVARVRERFADGLPRATREFLHQERLDDAQLARIERAQDVPSFHRRLRRAEHALEHLWSMMDTAAEAPLQRGESWAEEAAPGEVLALLHQRLRERLLHERDAGRTPRLLAARQVRALGQAGQWHRPANTSAHAVAQRMAQLLLDGDSPARGGEDLALWGELLGAAADALHDPDRATGWAAQLADAPLPEARETGSTRFVLPIDNTYALISPHRRSSVRVRGKQVALDRRAECTVFLEHGDAETLPLARLDVEPLFDGLQAAPAWYATARNAQLQVIARVGDEWIARVVRRGTLRGTKGRPWDPERSDGGRLRVLGTLAAPAPAEPWEVGVAPGAERVFCGMRTVPVVLPLAECATAWLRVPAAAGWASDAVVAEERCLRAMARVVPFTVPGWAGRGQLSARHLQGPVYVPPLGLRAAELPPLDAWLRSGASRPLLGAAARLWLRITKAGYALGVYHADAFLFAIGWGGAGKEPAAHAVVTDAPFAAPLGKFHRRPPPDEALVPFYASLGCRVLPPAAAAGEVALPATEVQAFALFALDVLAQKPLPLSGIVPCEALAEMVPDFAASFVYPQTATRLSVVLRSGAKTDGVANFIQRMAES